MPSTPLFEGPATRHMARLICRGTLPTHARRTSIPNAQWARASLGSPGMVQSSRVAGWSSETGSRMGSWHAIDMPLRIRVPIQAVRVRSSTPAPWQATVSAEDSSDCRSHRSGSHTRSTNHRALRRRPNRDRSGHALQGSRSQPAIPECTAMVSWLYRCTIQSPSFDRPARYWSSGRDGTHQSLQAKCCPIR